MSSPSQKRADARDTLTPDQWVPFDELVDDYRFACEMRYGRAWVNYAVLADLIRQGWRTGSVTTPPEAP